MYRNKKRGRVGIIITIVFIILLVVFTNENMVKISTLEKVMNSVVMPIQNGLTYLKNNIQGNDDFFKDINSLQEENAELKIKNSELEQSLREYEMLKAENETLKEYVNLTDKYANYTTIPAYVINKDIGNYSNIVIINVGEADGIEENMTVITDAGLVGHIISTTSNTSKVQTIIDPATSITSSISTTKDSIIVQGSIDLNNLLKATFIPTDASIMQDDIVETSGIGGIYPKGIKVGMIKDIYNTKDIIDRYATVETAVDFEKLDTVLVILSNN